MAPQDLSPSVRAFIADHIRSVEDLHLLIMVIQAPDRWWDAAQAGRELMITPGAARRVLDHFAKGNLLDIRITDDLRYQFAPGTEELRRAALEFHDAYRVQPLAVLRQVTGTSRRSIKDFADAFRIRRDDDR